MVMSEATAGMPRPATAHIARAEVHARRQDMGPPPGVHELTPGIQGPMGLPEAETIPGIRPAAVQEAITPAGLVVTAGRAGPHEPGEVPTGVPDNHHAGAVQDPTGEVAVTEVPVREAQVAQAVVSGVQAEAVLQEASAAAAEEVDPWAVVPVEGALVEDVPVEDAVINIIPLL